MVWDKICICKADDTFEPVTLQSETYASSPCYLMSPQDTISSSASYISKEVVRIKLLLPHFFFPPRLGPRLGERCMFTPRMTQMVCALYNMTTALNMNAALLTTHDCGLYKV